MAISEVSPYFRNGQTLTQLISALRRSTVLPAQDERMRLEVFTLKKRVRSVNNRRLWVLKEFQKDRLGAAGSCEDELGPEMKQKDATAVEVAVNMHPLCKGTAKFIADWGAPKVPPHVAQHNDTAAASATLAAIADAPLTGDVSRTWVFLGKATNRRR
eukprot:Skav236381  [mRNA]  locus=scaffold2027:177984:181515:+ [translate_table: standard]